MNDILDCLINGIKVGDSYPPFVRAFCISLHSISPKAFNYVRTKFGNHLPHPEVIREWFRNSNLDAKSGITISSMNALEAKAEKMRANGGQLVVSLLWDEMAIMREMTWCRASNKLLGLVDCGTMGDDDFTLATNVLVFMVTGLKEFFQQPVAYYFHTSLKGNDRVCIMKQVLEELTKRGVKVCNVTFDGYSANSRMCEIFGANLSDRNGDYITHFPNPVDLSNVYIIYDPSHMEKLIRTILGSQKTFFIDKEKIEWKYFERLVELSTQKTIGLTHKLNKRHIQYEDRKMHVRTAVETLSSSTANSMEFLLNRGDEGFVGAGPTVKFVRMFDKIWDIMNSHRIQNQNVFKSAINPNNKREIFIFLHEAKKYILKLKIKSGKSKKLVPIVNTIQKTGFRGFVVNIISLIAMYTELVEETHWLNFFATYRLSQDHIEMLFSRIRSMNGSNDNPQPFMFISSYRKILHQCEIASSPYANVQNLAKANAPSLVTSDILSVPSFKNRRSRIADSNQPELLIPTLDSEINEIYEIADFEMIVDSDYITDTLHDSGISFIASKLEEKLFTCGQVYCDICIKVLNSNRKVDTAICLNENNKPCLSTYQICKITDTALKSIVFSINRQPNLKQKIFNTVMRMLEWHGIFPEFFENEHDFEHKHFLIKFFVDEYVNKKCAYLAKQKTLELQKKYVRHRYRKATHFQHQ